MFLDRFKSLLQDPPPGMAFEVSEAGIASAKIGVKTELEFHPFRARTVTVSPLEANISDPDDFLLTLREAIKTPGARRGRDVAVILPDYCARIAVLDFDSFPSDVKEQTALVKFRLKRAVPFDVETAALSYFAQAAVNKKVDVVVVIAPLEIVSPYESPFRTAGLNPGMLTTSALAALELAPDAGVSVFAKLSGNVLTVLVRNKETLKLARCLELPSNDLDSVSAVLLPTFVYVEDNLGHPADRLILCGFGPETDEAQRRFQQELGVEVEPLRSPLGAPGEHNAGLLGYLRSIARNN